jgi:hypothetical protein
MTGWYGPNGQTCVSASFTSLLSDTPPTDESDGWSCFQQGLTECAWGSGFRVGNQCPALVTFSNVDRAKPAIRPCQTLRLQRWMAASPFAVNVRTYADHAPAAKVRNAGSYCSIENGPSMSGMGRKQRLGGTGWPLAARFGFETCGIAGIFGLRARFSKGDPFCLGTGLNFRWR